MTTTPTILPPARGKLMQDAALAPLTWLRVGGPADVLFLPADEADLSHFLAALDPSIPVFPMGAASNLIVRDGGIRGVVVRLSAAFGAIALEEGHRLRVGAACLDKKVAKAAAMAGIAGLEFLAGIPGTIGGAVRMNAGCYGTEVCDRLVEIAGFDRRGRRAIMSAADLGFSYRHSELPDDFIVTSALFQGAPGETAAIEARIGEINAAREASQPIREKTGGSTFANPDPPGTPDQRKAWQLIDSVGGRGLTRGGARFSEQHCNFLINDGTAMAADLEELGEQVRARVRTAHGIDLQWEVRRVGEPR